jgi:hypothetical protein
MDYLDKLIKGRGRRFAKKVDKALARREFERKAKAEYKRTGWVLSVSGPPYANRTVSVTRLAVISAPASVASAA